MNGLFLLPLIVFVVSLVWALSPAITNTKTSTGNWYYTFPLVLVFASLAGIATLLDMDSLWILGFLVLSSLSFVRAIILRSQYRKFQFSDD